jgi:hypothetical protein
MMEANPEMAHMMNDPEMMRQAMRMATNPVQSANAPACLFGTSRTLLDVWWLDTAR